MNFAESDRKKLDKSPPKLLIISVLLSLLLHIVSFVLLPLIPREEKVQLQPTMVQLVDKPRTVKKKPPQKTRKPATLEIDQAQTRPEPTKPVKSQRKADFNQRVEKEQAPKGDDVRDQKAAAVPPPRPAPPPPPKTVKKPLEKKIAETKKAVQPKAEKSPRVVKKKSLKPVQKPPREEEKKREEKVVEQPVKKAPQQPPPDLFKLTPKTLDSLNRGTLGQRNRNKQRDDVAIGDTVWLNLQNNMLVSFFRRFHNQIEMVWNYPTRAARAGIEGTLELQIVVNRKGELLDVDVINSSGSDILDYEAIQAVYRAAPFGPLTKYYPHEKLKIRAHFSYRLSGRFIYGN